MSLPARILVWLVSLYRSATANRLSPCRFVPSCSQYGLDAIRTHGALRGSWLTIRRLARCRPFSKAGIDPVPEPRKA